MRFSKVFVISASLVIHLATPLPTQNNHAAHEKRQITSSQWLRRNQVSSQHILSVRIGLAQNNLERGHEVLMDMCAIFTPFISYQQF